MSSESELSIAKPDDGEIEQALRDVVREIFEAGKADTLSANAGRAAAEEKLGLDSGFLKSSLWKSRSKEIIQQTLVSVLQTFA